MGSGKARLAADDLDEIYYALQVKAERIERGRYDSEPGEVGRLGSETARWAAHLRRIMAKIRAR
jgi:hypothetical protein